MVRIKGARTVHIFMFFLSAAAAFKDIIMFFFGNGIISIFAALSLYLPPPSTALDLDIT